MIFVHDLGKKMIKMTKICSKCGSTDLLNCSTISLGVIYTLCKKCEHIDVYNQKVYDKFKQFAKEHGLGELNGN